MKLHGQNLIGDSTSVEGTTIFQSFNPASGAALQTSFFEATPGEIDRAMRFAAAAFPRLRDSTPEARASFLEAISEEIDGLGDQLLETAHTETALPLARCASERARALLSAAEACGMPEGVFSMVHGRGHEVGLALVNHPETRAVSFTGSLAGGRALFDAASSRPEPIPFYAEMGSVNPVFVFPGALSEGVQRIAEGYVQSLNMGVGQFCTNPGLLLGVDGAPLKSLIAAIAERAAAAAPATMLHRGIHEAYIRGVEAIGRLEGVTLAASSTNPPDPGRSEAACYVFEAASASLRKNPELFEEVFGPAATIIRCESTADFAEAASALTGSLTATIHGTPKDLAENRELLGLIESKVGRLIFNGYPTGIEVCASMHHGGPYPATTHSHFTSIGTRCIYRFTRPVCYQGWPDDALPPELRNRNAQGIWRLVNNRLTRDDC